MDRSTKIFMAAGLIAAGYGVATLLGSPGGPYVPRPFPSPAAELSRAVESSEPPREAQPLPAPIAGVRLLPHVSADENVIRPREELAYAAPPRTYPTTTAEPIDPGFFAWAEAAVHSPAPAGAGVESIWGPTPSIADAKPSESPVRAHLRDASPRVTTDGAAELKTTQPKKIETPARAPEIAPPPWTTPTVNMGVASPAAAPAAVPAAYLATPALSSTPPGIRLTSIAPPPQPPPPQRSAPAPPRIHRIVDGDSLPKLAKRYLQDGTRADEIFALNRDVLTSPDLLPIGAELKLPAVKEFAGGD